MTVRNIRGIKIGKTVRGMASGDVGFVSESALKVNWNGNILLSLDSPVQKSPSDDYKVEVTKNPGKLSYDIDLKNCYTEKTDGTKDYSTWYPVLIFTPDVQLPGDKKPSKFCYVGSMDPGSIGPVMAYQGQSEPKNETAPEEVDSRALSYKNADQKSLEDKRKKV